MLKYWYLSVPLMLIIFMFFHTVFIGIIFINFLFINNNILPDLNGKANENRSENISLQVILCCWRLKYHFYLRWKIRENVSTKDWSNFLLEKAFVGDHPFRKTEKKFKSIIIIILSIRKIPIWLCHNCNIETLTTNASIVNEYPV